MAALDRDPQDERTTVNQQLIIVIKEKKNTSHDKLEDREKSWELQL